MAESFNKQLTYMEYMNRETGFHHHRYETAMQMFDYVRMGDERAIAASRARFDADDTGKLSDDPIKNRLYLSICTVTMITRSAIEGGMDQEKAYNASDIFIRRFDKLRTPEEFYDLTDELFTFFLEQVREAKKNRVISKPIRQCIDYIDTHLHETVTVEALAQKLNMNRSYLSTLFKKETGATLSEYVIKRRVETAKNMLINSDFTPAEISDILNYSSYSHFARVFRKYYDTSPKKYRMERMLYE